MHSALPLKYPFERSSGKLKVTRLCSNPRTRKKNTIPSLTSHTKMRPSSEPIASWFPEGAHAKELMASALLSGKRSRGQAMKWLFQTWIVKKESALKATVLVFLPTLTVPSWLFIHNRVRQKPPVLLDSHCHGILRGCIR